MLAAVLISLSLVGIDITVLGVFGGALGVGLGFGLQKIASNYVSGLHHPARPSLRLGDTINVSGLQGMVTQIRTRYTVVRGLDGIETLIPNEKLITDVVQNQSSYLTRGYAKVAVQVSVHVATSIRRWRCSSQADAGRRARAAGPGADRLTWRASDRRYQSGTGFLDRGCRDRHVAACARQVNRNIWRLFRRTALQFRSRNAKYGSSTARPSRLRMR